MRAPAAGARTTHRLQVAGPTTPAGGSKGVARKVPNGLWYVVKNPVTVTKFFETERKSR